MTLLPPGSKVTGSRTSSRGRLEKTYLLGAVGLLVLYIFPYVWLGEGAYLTIHDNLDSDFLYLHLLKISNTAFNFDLSAVVPNVMNAPPTFGIPRSAFRTGLNLEVLSFYLLPTYVAYIVNFAAVHGIGFVGMYWLLRTYILPERTWAFTRVALALLFAVVPGYVVHGVSVSGQPLLLLAFLNLLHHRPRRTDWLIIAFFPVYSFFVWSGLFICVTLALIGLVSMVQRREINRQYVLGLAILSGLYVVSEWEMIYSFLAKTYISHRTEYDYSRLLPLTIADSLRRSFYGFVQTQYHSGAFVTVGIVVVAMLAGWRAWRIHNRPALLSILGMLCIAGVICLVNGFYRFPAVWLGRGSVVQAFQFDRFYFLLPVLWYLLFALSLRMFAANGVFNRLFLLGQVVVMLMANGEYRTNVAKLAGIDNRDQFPAYRAFYASRQMTQIRNYIGQPPESYRVVSVGVHPAVALYNGFYTLDSYQNNYLLSYKHAFRRVIERELAKAPAIENYFDAYGCRCYTYSAELGMSVESMLCGKHTNRRISQLSLNPDALSALGGKYVISAVPIQNATANRLRLERIFSDSESYWRIWLYRVHGAGLTRTGAVTN